MTRTRRQFIQQSVSSGALAAGGMGAFARNALGHSQADSKPRKQKILILGGTGFLGPALIQSVLARGHELTLFNSGSTEQRRETKGRPSVIPEGVEVLLGNRDPEQTADDRRLRGDPDAEKKRDPNSPRGLSSLKDRHFDAVIDTSGYFPRMVKASAEFLAPNIDQYIFISTISVYADNSKPGADETAELVTLEDPTTEEFGASFENYGGGKALCEAAAEAAMPGKTTNIRPGFIVGPLDTSRRYLYWPWRVAQGGEMLVPGSAADPVQIIDVRDLADWTVRCIEQRTTGVFNATGPEPAMTMGEMLKGCAAGVGGDPTFVYADSEFLAEQGLRYPIWVSPKGDTAGFHRVSIERAVNAGLTFRTPADTAKATLDWCKTLDEDLQQRIIPINLKEGEADALVAWKAKQE